MKWQRDESTATAVSWVGDTQVMYAVAREEHGSGHFVAQRLVTGAAARGFVTIGARDDIDDAIALAESDNDQVQAKGF